MKTITGNFTTFHRLLVPLVNQLRKVAFPRDKPRKRDDEELHSRMREIPREARQDLVQ